MKRYGQVMEDGKWDLADAGSVGLYGGLGGLNTVVSTLTLGLAHFDSEEVARDLERRAMESLKGDSWASNYVKDQSNHLFFRFGVSMGMATDVLCKKVASDVSEGTRIVGSWVSNAQLCKQHVLIVEVFYHVRKSVAHWQRGVVETGDKKADDYRD